MFYLISMYWGWMLAALVLGAVIGWLIFDEVTGWSRTALILFVVGVLLAVFHAFPGVVGLWLETALLLFASYMVGSLVAWFVRSWTGDKPVAKTLATTAAVSAAAAGMASAARPSGVLPGKQPARLVASDMGKADDLKLIKGIGPKNELVLNNLGTYKFGQIAAWGEGECKWVGHHIAFPGRVEREHWVDQAKLLAGGADTEFSKAVKAGTIKLDASADAPLGEADIALLKQDVGGRAAALVAVSVAAKTAEAERVAQSAKAAAALQQAEAAKAAEAAKLAAQAKAAEAARSVETAKAAEAAKLAKSAKDAAALKQAEAAATAHPGSKPAVLMAAAGGVGDDLKLIKGIGPKNESILHSLGIWHFSQIAQWQAEEEKWVGHHMAFPGRVEREHWVEQARLLGAGMDTEHSAGVKAGTIQIDASADAPLSEADAGKLKSSMPEIAAPVADEGKFAGKRPLGLAKPRGGKADDLKRIRGIGPQNEGRLHGLGIWHFNQIANWTHDQVLWVGGYLAFPGRIDREDWISQAKLLATGTETEFSKRVDKGLVATSKDDGSKGQGNVAPLPGTKP